MKMGLVQLSMTGLCTNRPEVTTMSLRTAAAVSGMRFQGLP